MRVLVYGGRDFADRRMAYITIDRLHARHSFTAVIHGDDPGAARLARDWARAHEIPDEPFGLERKRHRDRAELIRNQTMIDAGRPGFAIELPGGSADMRSRCVLAGVPHCEVTIRYPRRRLPFVVGVENWWRGL